MSEEVQQDEKLQKVLARAGFGSRRTMESWIDEGRVRVNGKVASIGDRVTPEDTIHVDGKKVANMGDDAAMPRVLLYNKPENEICSMRDPEGRPSVYDHLPPIKHGRWVAVGRLDFNTSGLLLFTTDGELANRLMHPSSNIDREYAVRINGDVTDEMIKTLLKGVMIEEHLCRFTDVQYFAGEGRNRWYHVVIMEGRNREVRKLWESQGVRVSRLKRVRYGPVFIPSRVKKGQFYEMKTAEVVGLYELAGLTPPSGSTRRPARPQKRRR
ncbi:23S rRNA pseudouridine(2605) synthase RluB [Pseudohongiella spirulinae]|uniref:Pseudouridine synthase n=1 Tax=Pseudohongiella spirulinae TaxID=1249552 RepID=A0A0S2KDA3_9GAMM|nr:pseudouridine synthase [Pseudohongiella spirulinae]ALO46295.1 Pseudouridine synthase [Pseudohongiella spirulinae]